MGWSTSLSPVPSAGPGAGQGDSVTLMKECVRSLSLTSGLIASLSCSPGQPVANLAAGASGPSPKAGPVPQGPGRGQPRQQCAVRTGPRWEGVISLLDGLPGA